MPLLNMVVQRDVAARDLRVSTSRFMMLRKDVSWTPQASFQKMLGKEIRATETLGTDSDGVADKIS